MPSLWSDRAIQEQRRFNRLVEQFDNTRPIDGLTHQLLPTLVTTRQRINPGESGQFVFLRGNIATFDELPEDEDEGWNLIMDEAIPAGVVCLAQRVMLPDSGEAGYVLIRIPSPQPAAVGEFDCAECSTGLMPRIPLTITGLVDLDGSAPHFVTDPTFDGWAAKLNNTGNNPGHWDLQHSLPFSACTPGLSFTVPYNSDGDLPLGFQTLNLALLGEENLLWSPGGVIGFGWDPLSHIGFDIRGLDTTSWLYYEENPANLMTRSSGKVVCSQTYSDYTYLQGEFLQGTNFKTWIDQGTFQIN